MLMDAPIETPRLILRTLRSGDVGEEYISWLSDPEVTRYLEIRFTVQTIQGAREFISAMNASEDSLFLGMFLKSRATHIGNIKLGPMDWHHRRGDIGLVIGDKVQWGKGYATEAIRGVTDYAFGVLEMHKLSAGLYDANEGSRRAFLKAGWFEEGRRRDHWLSEGKWQDDIQLGCINGDAP